MDLVHFLHERDDGTLELCSPGYKDTTEARKHYGELAVGTYHLISLVETGIQVTPPEAPTTNRVVRGSVLRTRVGTKKKDDGKGKGK
jgi:hypothetical protein